MFLFSIPYIINIGIPSQKKFFLPLPRHFLQVDQRIVHPSQVPFQVEAQSEVSRSGEVELEDVGIFHGKMVGKCWENHGIIMGMENVWNVGIIMGKSWENHGIIMGNMFGKLHKKKQL